MLKPRTRWKKRRSVLKKKPIMMKDIGHKMAGRSRQKIKSSEDFYKVNVRKTNKFKKKVR
ncbi:MAG: hypothetical protein CMB80_09255 [Flammeovirgaceae bacterium]|jgi:hypothetical protein|nr:hypothetical protein [Flammeovirgaceae bacterium]|tara:strand:+ start:1049 stop:1228 length:180 start_codon:yes stop_codon:yes gene_type:complete